MMGNHPGSALALALTALTALLFAAPAPAKADPPATGEHLEKTATDFVTQVVALVDAVKRDKEAARTDDDAADAEHDRDHDESVPEDGGVVPTAVAVVRLLKGRLALRPRHHDGDDASSADVFLKLKPRKAGGYLRCEIRF